MDEIINLYKAGKTLSFLEREFKISRHLIGLELKKRNILINSHPQRVDCLDISKLKLLLKNYKNYIEISKEFNVTPQQVFLWCKKFNLKSKVIGGRIIRNIPTKNELELDYINNGLSCVDIGKKWDVSSATIKTWLISNKIPIRMRTDTQKLASLKVQDTKLARYGYKNFPLTKEYKRSKGEKEIEDFLNSNGFEFESTRKVLSDNLELDCFDKDRKFAIEFCGVRYHNEGPPNYRGRSYHYNKWKQCHDLGIRLITIFDLEWITRKRQIENFLLASLGKFNQRVYARDCEVIKLEFPNRKFFEDTHIQGCPKQILSMYGLFYNDELVGGVTYSYHPRDSKKTSLSRVAFKGGFQVVGGASKLIHNSIKDVGKNIITWSDNRWSEGNIYEKSGFKLEAEIPPGYFYTNTEKIRSAQSMQKNAIGCPKDITEKDFCQKLNWFRVWDCGKKRWSFFS